jgi:hypothetical protein
VTTLQLISPIPGEITLTGELPDNDVSLSAAMFQQAALPEDKLVKGLANVVQSTQEQNPMTGSFNQTSSNSFEVRISDIVDDEFTIVRTAQAAQTKNPMGGFALSKAEPVEDTFYREELYQVYNFSHLGKSIRVNPTFASQNLSLNANVNAATNFANGNLQMQYQSCLPSQISPQTNDYKVHYYLGSYKSPHGGPEIPVYIVRRSQTARLTCATQTMNYLNFNLGFHGSGQANTPPPPPANPVAPNPAVAPATTEIQYIYEEIYAYAPRALIIGNYSLDRRSAIPLFQMSSTQIVGGAIISKQVQMIHAPTF